MKINGMEVCGEKIAYDGCHKIYVLEDKEDIVEAKDMGYDIIPIKHIQEVYDSSCGLQFISNWQLDVSYADQFEDAVFE